MEGGAVRTHGKVGTYSKGCRCARCRRAASEWGRDRYRREPKGAPLRHLRDGSKGAKNHDDRIDALLEVLAR